MYRLIGGALIIGGVVAVCRGYESYLRRGQRQAEGFLGYLCAKRRSIANYKSKRPITLPDGEGKTLLEMGFLERLRLGESSEDAYRSTEGSSCLSPEARHILEKYFSRCGREYMEGELKLLDGALSALGELVEKTGKELPKRIRLIYTLGLAAGMGMLLLII